MTKSQLRLAARSRLQQISTPQRMVDSQVIAEKIMALPAFSKAGKVLFYAAGNTEPETRDIFLLALQAATRPTALFPRVVPNETRLELRAIKQWEDLKPGSFGLLEPDPETCSLEKNDGIDAILIPGLAYDRGGARLGRGSGYYDRLLSLMPANAIRIGCFFACQEFPDLPRQEHDMMMHWIVTEKEVIEVKK